MQRRTQFFILLVATSLVLLACDLGSLGLGSGKPTVVINSPPSGSQFREGEDVSIQSTSTDSSGIMKVELLVDGAVVRSDNTPSAQISYVLIQTWKATPGTHVVGVRAYNKGNAVSDLAALSLTVAAGGTAPTATSVAAVPSSTRPSVAATTAATAPPGCSNNAAFVTDVNVPDGTVMAPGQAFNKIWRLKNTGTCTWGSGYLFVFVAGEAMTTTTSVVAPSTAPGATADLQVAMTASSTLGTRTGQWRLKAPNGAFFGDTVRVVINVRATTTSSPPPASATATRTVTPTSTPGPCPGAPVISSFSASSTTITTTQPVTLTWGSVTNADSAEIDQDIGGIATPGSTVVTPTVTTTYTLTATGCGGTTTRQVTITVAPAGPVVQYDFVAKGPDAQWVTCRMTGTVYIVVGWNGSDTDDRGFVKPRPGSAMEDGATYPKLLETHPNFDPNGCISGTYPAYTVQSGDRFRAKVGFLQGGSAGNVTFQLNYREGTALNSLNSWSKAYNGSLTDVNVDLSSIVGHNVQFALAVLAGPSAGQDWATWIAPRVEH